MNTTTQTAFWEAVDGILPAGCPRESWAAELPVRERLGLRVYREKASDANPYYPSNEALNRCATAVKEIIGLCGPHPCAERLAAACEAVARLTEEPLARDFGYAMTHHLVTITRMAGGHRGPIVNDTEIDLLVTLLPGTSAEAFFHDAEETCRKHGVSLLRLS